MKNTLYAGVIALSFLSAGTTANAASFNCRYAKLPAELTICQSDRLHRMDERMASKYFRLKQRLPYAQRRQLGRDQKHWLRSRNRCGYNHRCVVNSYALRIRELNNWLDSY